MTTETTWTSAAAAWPRVDITINANGAGVVNTGVGTHPLAAGDMAVSRERARAIAVETARKLGRPVRGRATDPSGSLDLIFSPDGATYLDESAASTMQLQTDPIPDPPLEVAAPTIPLSGPRAPQTGMTLAGEPPALPVREQRGSASVWWVGVHGGAAETSLAGLVSGWVAAGHAWPRPVGGAPARVVLCARTSWNGLNAARAAARQWAAGQLPHVELLGLVLTADAPGRLPRDLRDFAQVITGGVPHAWSLPWIESWRLGEPAALDTAPRGVRRLVDDVTALYDPDAAASATERNKK